MIDLYCFPTLHGLPFNPYCMRLQAFLRVSKIPFRIIETKNFIQTIERKLPYIRDNHIQISDDQLILDYLQNKLDFNFDSHLDNHQKACHFAFESLLFDQLYPVILAGLWLDDNNRNRLKKLFFNDIPPVFSQLKMRPIQQSVRRLLEAKGYHDTDLENLYQQGANCLAHLAAYLGQQQWYGGIYIAKLDLSVLSVLHLLLISDFNSPLIASLNEHTRLKSYLKQGLGSIFTTASSDQNQMAEPVST